VPAREQGTSGSKIKASRRSARRMPEIGSTAPRALAGGGRNTIFN
jgi:hypothetical protein